MFTSKKFLAGALVAASLFGGVSSATAADTKDAAVASAQAQATFRAQIDAYVTAHRAIIDTRRAAAAKALADFQAALANVTTDAQLQAAKDARKSAMATANATAKAAIAALTKPVKPAKPAKAQKPATTPTA